MLHRKKEVRTNIDTSIQSAHCPNCGAAESDVASHACSYCGVNINDGSYDWVLAELVSTHTERAHQWRHELSEQHAQAWAIVGRVNVNIELSEWMIQIMAADGQLRSKEQEALHGLCAKLGLGEPHATELIHAAASRHAREVHPPDLMTGKMWLESVVDLALSDGTISQAEHAVLLKLGFSDIDLNLLINRRRHCMERRDT